MSKKDHVDEIDDLIRAEIGGYLSSMVPETKEEKKERKAREAEEKKLAEKESIPLIEDVTHLPMVRLKIRALTRKIYELGMQEKQVKAAKGPLLNQLKELIAKNKIESKKFMVDDLQILRYPTSRSTISDKKLLENGVAPVIITASTVTTNSEALKISMPGEKDDE